MEFCPAAKACCHSSPLVKQVLLCGFSALVFHGIFLVFQTLQLHDALVRIGLLPKHSIASSCLDVITYFLPEQEASEPNVGLNVITYFPQEQVDPEQVEIAWAQVQIHIVTMQLQSTEA